MIGQLREHPLAELIREIAAARLSGVLRLERERVKKTVYFDDGEIVLAASNYRPLRLAECLKRWGVFAEQQLAAFSGLTTDAELGAALISRGALDRSALEELVSRQVTDILRPALLWTDGAWSFDARVRLVEDVRAMINTRDLLMESARRLPPEFVARRFKSSNESLSPEASVSTSFNFLPTEAFILSRIDAPVYLHQLISMSGLPEAEVLRACYVLALGGFLKRDGWPQAFSPAAMAQALAMKAALPKTETTAPAPKSKEQVAAQTEIDEQSELEALFERLGRATNHYEVMGVSRTAKPDVVKQTYHQLARRFHPDKYHQDEALRSRLEVAFTAIAQAYETLKEQQSRAAYDLKLRAGGGQPSASANSSGAVGTGAPPAQAGVQNSRHHASQTSSPSEDVSRAEARFQQGVAALKQGNRMMALSLLAEAAQLKPQQAHYRAQYGQALSSEAKMRRQAEAELQAAITLDPRNASYRVMLAELYTSIGLLRRAQAELERALSIEPQNQVAQRLYKGLLTAKK
jgi:curved DNA-binding protein CbpA